MTLIVVVESESDKPTGWGVGYITQLNDDDDSNYHANMYSEINHSLNFTHILKFEFLVLCHLYQLMSWWYGSARLQHWAG